jgi:hypothetical protein
MEASRIELPDAQDDPAEDVGVDGGLELDLAAGLLADLAADALDRGRVELDGRGDLDRAGACSPRPRAGRTPAEAEDRRHAVLLDEQLEEVLHDGVGAVEQPSSPSFFSAVEKYGREEERLQLAVAVQGLRELAELLLDHVDLPAVLGDLEERAGVDAGDLLHA